MVSPFASNLGYAVLTVFLSFIVLVVVVRHPALEHESTFIELPDGRHVSYLTRGQESAPNKILWLHGMLSCRHESSPIPDDLLKELDAFLIAPDRAVPEVVEKTELVGYGESSVTSGRNFASNTEDLVSLLDTLEINKVFLVGVSGGGPHAFSFAARYPERVRGILSLSAACESGLFHADRIQGFDQPPEPKIFSIYRYLKRHPRLLYGLQSLSEFYSIGRALYSLFLENVAKHALSGFSEADRRCVQTKQASYLVKVVPGALRQGIATPVIQDIISVMMTPPEEFSEIPDDLQKATQLWHSDKDPQVNPVCLQDYKKLFPLAKERVVKGGGHFAYWSCQNGLQREAFQNLILGGLPVG